METIKWDANAALAKASKGSFAEKAVRIDVYKNRLNTAFFLFDSHIKRIII